MINLELMNYCFFILHAGSVANWDKSKALLVC